MDWTGSEIQTSIPFICWKNFSSSAHLCQQSALIRFAHILKSKNWNQKKMLHYDATVFELFLLLLFSDIKNRIFTICAAEECLNKWTAYEWKSTLQSTLNGRLWQHLLFVASLTYLVIVVLKWLAWVLSSRKTLWKFKLAKYPSFVFFFLFCYRKMGNKFRRAYSTI